MCVEGLVLVEQLRKIWNSVCSAERAGPAPNPPLLLVIIIHQPEVSISSVICHFPEVGDRAFLKMFPKNWVDESQVQVERTKLGGTGLSWVDRLQFGWKTALATPICVYSQHTPCLDQITPLINPNQFVFFRIDIWCRSKGNTQNTF